MQSEQEYCSEALTAARDALEATSRAELALSAGWRAGGGKQGRCQTAGVRRTREPLSAPPGSGKKRMPHHGAKGEARFQQAKATEQR